jgi:hypothetical protein
MHTGVMVSIDYSRCLVRLLTSLQGFRRMLKRNAPSRLSISQNYLETSRFHVKTLFSLHFQRLIVDPWCLGSPYATISQSS